MDLGLLKAMKGVIQTDFLVKREEIDTLEKLIATTATWLKPRAHVDLDEFKTGTTKVKDDKEVTTIFIEGEKVRKFGLRFEHDDKERKNFRWQTTVCFQEPYNEPENIGVSIRLSNGFTTSGLQTSRYDITKPNLIGRIISNFHAHDSLRISTDGLSIHDHGDLEAAARWIEHPKRQMPIIYMSEEFRTGRTVIPVAPLARNLAGLAIVLNEDEPRGRMSSYLSEENQLKLACYNGSIRIYWPMGDGSSGVHHRYWTPFQIKEFESKLSRISFSNFLLKIIADQSLSRKPILTFSDLELENQRNEILELSIDTDYEQIVGMYSKENERLKSRIEELELEGRETVSRTIFLENRVSELEERLSEFEDVTEQSEDEKQLTSVDEALRRFQNKNPKNVIVLSKAKSGAKNYLFEDPEMIYRALNWLNTTYIQIRTGKIQEPNIDENARRLIGMGYSGGQTQTTMGRCKQDYFADYKGQSIPLEEHLKFGTSRDPRKSIRIGFYYDKDAEVVVLGYIGQHQKNSKT